MIAWWLAYLSILETSGHLADVKIRESGLANYFFFWSDEPTFYDFFTMLKMETSNEPIHQKF